eukprot:356902-Chlamydomonas_euryale.AAC.5
MLNSPCASYRQRSVRVPTRRLCAAKPLQAADVFPPPTRSLAPRWPATEEQRSPPKGVATGLTSEAEHSIIPICSVPCTMLQIAGESLLRARCSKRPTACHTWHGVASSSYSAGSASDAVAN